MTTTSAEVDLFDATLAAARWLRDHASPYVGHKVECWRVTDLVTRIDPGHGARHPDVEILRAYAQRAGIAATLRAIALAVERIGEAQDEPEGE